MTYILSPARTCVRYVYTKCHDVITLKNIKR